MQAYRGFVALLLVLALALGIGRPMSGVMETQTGAYASKSVLSAVTADASMSGMCEKCIKNDRAAHACSGLCIGAQAILPSITTLRVAARARLTPLAHRGFAGAPVPP